ncbi:MAG TPA: hypothetical protein VFV50_15515 [Bdellovibrionales bacterium]|nr:hypothetical protein [Bdellovibrionales bacterium]
MRSYCLLATPRSGSTLIHTILAEYLRKAQNVTGLYEFFNLRQRVHIREGLLRPGAYAKEAPPLDLYERLVEQRMRMLDEAPGRYFFSVHPGQLDNRRLWGWLFKNHHVVFCERLNLFDQYLSYLISLKTEQWNGPARLHVPEGTLELKPQYAERIANRLAEWYTVYRALKTRAPSNPVIVYEEVTRELQPERICQAAGFNKAIPLDELELPVKQNPAADGKLKYFTDPGAALDGYRRTALQDWYPI